MSGIVASNQLLHEGYSEAIEDFLKAVYLLQQDYDRVPRLSWRKL